jgi:hypothetical protein
MDESFLVRQVTILRQFIDAYRKGRLGLNSLIQRVESVNDVFSSVIASEVWGDKIFPIILLMEEVNAFALYEKRALTEPDKVLVDDSLCKLEILLANILETNDHPTSKILGESPE